MNIIEFYDKVSPYSGTSRERIYGLFECLEQIRKDNIKGDMVECGLWKGGNVLGICEYLFRHNITDVNVWGYDTFTGMTQPTDVDKDDTGTPAINIFEQVKCESPYEEVLTVLEKTYFPKSKIKLVVGDVLNTLDISYPENISLLRLDTDWYESTKKELEVLYPKLSSGGYMIVDDYGHWQGCRKAVNEYFNNSLKFKMFDYTGLCHRK
jgi:hypothetical protein